MAALSAADVRHTAPGAAVDEFRLAVLPFRHATSNDALGMLAEGLAEGILAGLLRFPWLRVVAAPGGQGPGRGEGRPDDARSARYLIEGSLRQGGARVRATVQLTDVVAGVALWAETYDRDTAADPFALQDDLVARIVSTVGDHFGVLARSICDSVRSREPAGLTPYEALMRGFGYHMRLTPEEHAVAREALEGAVMRAPDQADCLAMLAWVTAHEVAHGFNPRPGSLDRAFALARRAVELAPTNHLAHQALAVALFFRRETTACLAAAERAIALNPLDGSNEAFFLFCFTGHWDRGIPLIREAMERNPHHPRWYESILAVDEFRQGRHRAAADTILRLNAPEIFWNNVFLAAALGELGDPAARDVVGTLLSQKPDFATIGERIVRLWYDASLAGAVMDGLRKAGLGASARE